MAAQQCEWTYPYRSAHLKMIKMATYVLYVLPQFLKTESEKNNGIKYRPVISVTVDCSSETVEETAEQHL